MSLILDRMSSFVEQDLTHIGQYTVSKVNLGETLWDGKIISVEEVRDIINNTDYAMVDSLPKLKEGED